MKQLSMKLRPTGWVGALVFLGAFTLQGAAAQEETARPAHELRLIRAVMCEEVREGSPHNQGVVFSVHLGQVFCYTLFDPVPEDTSVYHTWYHRGQFSTRMRLSLKKPRWATFSRIRLREADKGPWRVEVANDGGKIMKVLRFSITD